MKKQIKSLISLCLAVIVFLAAPIAAKPAYAAEENGISVSKGKVSAGETFNVTINVPANTKRADTLSIRAEFDSSAFEVVEWEPTIADVSVTHSEPGAGFLSLSSANATSAIDLSRGLKFTATLKAKDGAKAGNYSFKLTKSSVSVYNEDTYTNEQLWEPAVKTAAVEIGEAFVPAGGIGISVSKSKVSNGETFDVAFTIPAIQKNADTVSIRAEYDNSAFEVVKWKPEISGTNVTYSEPDAGFLSLSCVNSAAVIDLSRGLKFTATLKARDDAKAGNYSFTLTKTNVSVFNRTTLQSEQLWIPDVKTAAVEIDREPVSSKGGGISVSKSKVSKDETFDVIFTVPANSQKADTLSIRAEFDSSAFEVVEWKPSIAGANVIHSEPDAEFLSLSSANAMAVIDLSGGLKFTAKLKVKDGAKAGKYSFTLAKNSVSYYDDVNNKKIELWSPEVKSASVTVEAIPADCVHSLVKTNAKASTCEVKGNNAYYTCSKCGKVFKDKDAKKPTTVEAETLALTKHSGGKADCLHKAVCKVCGKPYGSLGGHSYGKLIAKKDATCQREGMKAHYICSVCGKYFTEGKKATTSSALEIAKVPHNFRWVIDVSATATQTGLKHEECTYCGLKRNENTIIESHTHVFGKKWISDSRNHWHECSCGEKNAVAPHTSDGGKIIVTPTQTSSGYRAYTCTVCGYEIRRDVIPSVGPGGGGTGGFGGTSSGNGSNGTDNSDEIDKTEETEPEENTEQLPDTDPDDGDYDDSDDNSDNNGSGSEDDFWERVIRAINRCESGKTVLADMEDKDTVVPEEVFSALKGKDVGLRLKMGGGFSWKFNGSEIEEPQELDMGLELVEDYIDEELVDAVKNKLGSIQLMFNHEGDFGLTATLEIQVGEKNDGKYANLFYYNSDDDCLDFTDTDRINDGKAKLKLSHASEWLVTLSNTAYSGASRISLEGDTPAPSTSDIPGTPDKPSVNGRPTHSGGEVNPNTGMGLVLILPAAAGLSVALVKKTKRRRGKRR